MGTFNEPVVFLSQRGFFLFILSIGLLACLQSPSDAYSIQDGRMHYPENRPVPAFNATVLEDTANHTFTYLTYQSHGGVLVHAATQARRKRCRIPVAYHPRFGWSSPASTSAPTSNSRPTLASVVVM